MDNNKIQLFENKKIRTAWDEEKEEWYFSVVDVVGVLTEQETQRGASNYWAKLKERLKAEGANQLLTNCQQLKMTATDGKKRFTDVADTAQLLRIIQSIPSPKAEPFKMWLAEVGKERIDETIDPEITIDRALETYAKLQNPSRLTLILTICCVVRVIIFMVLGGCIAFILEEISREIYDVVGWGVIIGMPPRRA